MSSRGRLVEVAVSGEPPERSLTAGEMGRGHRLGSAERDWFFATLIEPQLLVADTDVEQATLVIVGGQPGAGKTAAMFEADRYLADSGVPARIVGDEFREVHPDLRALLIEDDRSAALLTNPDVSDWVTRALAWARSKRANVTLETSLGNPDDVCAVISAFAAAGYEVAVWVVATHPLLSELGSLSRYWGMRTRDVDGVGRYVAPSFHKARVEGLVSTLDRVSVECPDVVLRVLRRDGSDLWVSGVAQAPVGSTAPQALLTEHRRAPDLVEAAGVRSELEQLREVVGSLAGSVQELADVEDLRRRVEAWISDEVTMEGAR